MNQFIKLLKYIGISFIILILIAEIYLRLFFYEQIKTRSMPMIYKPDSLVGYVFIPNKKAHICIPSINKKFQLNNHGFYGPDFSTKKKAGTYRIIIDGSSFIEGIYLATNESLSMKLQRLFNENNQNKVEIINCSIGGDNQSLKHCELVRHYLLDYEPDLILIEVNFPLMNDNMVRDNYKGYAMNYAKGSDKSRKEAMKQIDRLYTDYKITRWFYNCSFIIRAIAKKYSETHYGKLSIDINTYLRKMNDNMDFIPYYFSYKSSVDYLKELIDYASKRNSRIVIFQLFKNITFIKLTNNNNLESLSFCYKIKKEYFYKHDRHPNDLGLELMAKAIYSEIIKKELVPVKYLK